MAKKSMIAREDKRKKLVKKYDVKRKSLKEIIRDPNATYEDKKYNIIKNMTDKNIGNKNFILNICNIK